MDIDKIKQDLVEELDKGRYDHTLRVVDTAIKLANVYQVDVEKAKIAALLHDCAKYKERKVLLKKADEFGIILDIILRHNHGLIHSYLGAEIAKSKYNIVDNDILNAIKFHTIGRENMSILEKIIFIADYIEPGRSFEGIEEIRDLAYKDIDEAMIISLGKTIKYVIDRGWLLHPNTIHTRNSLILSRTN